MKRPSCLRKGDKVAIISPAGPVDETELRSGLIFLESAGFDVQMGPHVYDSKGYLAGEDEDRLNDLHSVVGDKEIKAVFCTRGGYGCTRLLKDIDYGMVRANPKILVGYSDVTALLMAFYTMSRIVTFHGPMMREFDNGKVENWKNLIRLLSKNEKEGIRLIESLALKKGKAAGPILGGNLSLICHLAGTSFLPSMEGCILFIEDRGEPLYRIDRMLTHLELCGHLKGLAGLICGEFKECGDTSAVKKLMEAVSSGIDGPVIIGFPAGHGHKNLAFPIGVRAEIDTADMTLSFLEPFVAE